MIFIPGNVPSLKNSKRIVRGRLISSKLVYDYIEDVSTYFFVHKRKFQKMTEGLEYPLTIGLYFHRGSKHKFDYINAAQIIFDLMQKYGWIPDDSADYVVPFFMGYEYNKENPGVEIDLLYCYRGLDSNDEIG